MNNKAKIVLILSGVWVFVFVAYALSNPDNIQIQPDNQNLNFQQASNLVKGFLNTENSAIKTSMPKIP